MSDKPHFSQTQLESYCRCPEAYRRRYLDGDKIPPGIALLKGRGFHVGAETNLRQKIETHQDLPAGQIIDAAVAGFETDAAGEIMLSEEEAARGLAVVKGEAIDDLVDLVEAHAKQQAPDYQPIMVEQKVLIELDAPRDLMAVIDVADDHDRVTDFKTAGRSKSQGDADESIQLTVYASAFYAETGREASELRLDTIVQTKTKTTRQVVQTARGPRDFAALANRINAVQAAIDAGNFPPATPGAWWCGPKWCGYYQTCAYVNAEPYQLVQLETGR